MSKEDTVRFRLCKGKEKSFRVSQSSRRSSYVRLRAQLSRTMLTAGLSCLTILQALSEFTLHAEEELKHFSPQCSDQGRLMVQSCGLGV